MINKYQSTVNKDGLTENDKAMKHKLLQILILSLSLGMSACENSDSKTSPNIKIQNPLSNHADALKKAKSLEKELQESHKKRQQEIDSIDY